MTSKNYSSEWSLVLEAVKNKIWFLCIATILFLFTMPIPLTISLQRCHEIYDQKDMFFVSDIQSTLQHILVENEVVTFAVIAVAVLAGMIFFMFLHSRQKVDFYHSLPVSRTRLYLAQYLGGALSVLVPYLFFYLVNLAIIASFGDFRYLSASVIWLGLLRPIVYFLVIYSISVIAAMLTGNILVQFCVAVYFLFIVPLCEFLFYSVMMNFYKTFYEISGFWDHTFFWSSPVVQYVMAILDYKSSGFGHMAIYFIIALVLAGIGLALYRKRSSESAGKAIAFGWFKPIVKYPLSIAGGIGLGLLLNDMAYASGHLSAWFIFGGLLGLILVNRGVEVIFAFDIGALKKNWLSVGVSAVVAAVLIAVPALDLTGYDTYQPKESNVAKIVMDLPGVFYGDGTFDVYTLDTHGVVSPAESPSFEDLHGRMTLDTPETIAAGMDFAKNGIDHLEYFDEDTGDEYAGEDKEILAGDDSAYATVAMAFILKNGKIVYRQYTVDKKATLDDLEIILTNDTVRQRQLAYLDQEYTDISSGELCETGDGDNFTSPRDKNALIEAYRQDISELTFDDMKTTPIIGFLWFSPDYNTLEKNLSFGESVSLWQVHAPIYDSFTRTKEVLRSMGLLVNMADSSIISIESYSTEAEDSRLVEESEYDDILQSTLPSSELENNYFCQAGSEDGVFYTVTIYNEALGSKYSSDRHSGYRWTDAD